MKMMTMSASPLHSVPVRLSTKTMLITTTVQFRHNFLQTYRINHTITTITQEKFKVQF